MCSTERYAKNGKHVLVVAAQFGEKTVDSTPLTSKGVLKRNIYRPFPNKNVVVQWISNETCAFFLKWQVLFDFNWREKLEIFLDTKKSNFLDESLFLVQTENDKVFDRFECYTLYVFLWRISELKKEQAHLLLSKSNATLLSSSLVIYSNSVPLSNDHYEHFCLCV